MSELVLKATMAWGLSTVGGKPSVPHEGYQ
jgi:hypothetical protein